MLTGDENDRHLRCGCCDAWLHEGRCPKCEGCDEGCNQCSEDREPAATLGRTAESFNDDGDGWK